MSKNMYANFMIDVLRGRYDQPTYDSEGRLASDAELPISQMDVERIRQENARKAAQPTSPTARTLRDTLQDRQRAIDEAAQGGM
jgi:hypothetical protein